MLLKNSEKAIYNLSLLSFSVNILRGKKYLLMEMVVVVVPSFLYGPEDLKISLYVWLHIKAIS